MQLLWHQCAYANDYRPSVLLTLTSTAFLEVHHDSSFLFIFSQPNYSSFFLSGLVLLQSSKRPVAHYAPRNYPQDHHPFM
jgi:hypothetical protein